MVLFTWPALIYMVRLIKILLQDLHLFVSRINNSDYCFINLTRLIVDNLRLQSIKWIINFIFILTLILK